MLPLKSNTIDVIINYMIEKNPINRYTISDALNRMLLVTYKGINFKIDGLGV